MQYLSRPIPQSPGLLRKLAVSVASVALFGLALMFSALLFALVLVAGAAAWGWLWWRTRELRRQMGMQQRHGEVFDGEETKGHVIEGEVIRVPDPVDDR